jgi:hypothetical protein
MSWLKWISAYCSIAPIKHYLTPTRWKRVYRLRIAANFAYSLERMRIVAATRQ